MKNKQCPLCGEQLEVREVTPCYACGWLSDQVELLKHDINENYSHNSIQFDVYKIEPNTEITLCKFCALDIGSFKPETWGLKVKKRINYSDLRIQRVLIEPKVGFDMYCPVCNLSQKFISLILKIQDQNKEDK